MEGFIFGFVDNAIVVLGGWFGFDLEKRFSGSGKWGAVYGAGIANTFSDGLGAFLDPALSGFVLMIMLGCVFPVLALWAYNRIFDN